LAQLFAFIKYFSIGNVLIGLIVGDDFFELLRFEHSMAGKADGQLLMVTLLGLEGLIAAG